MSSISGSRAVLANCLESLSLDELNRFEGIELTRRLQQVAYNYGEIADQVRIKYAHSPLLIEEVLSAFCHLVLARVSLLPLKLIKTSTQLVGFYHRLYLESLNYGAPAASFDEALKDFSRPIAEAESEDLVRSLSRKVRGEAVLNVKVFAARRLLMEVESFLDGIERVPLAVVTLALKVILDASAYLNQSLAIACYVQMRNICFRSMGISDLFLDKATMKNLKAFEERVLSKAKESYSGFFTKKFFEPVFSPESPGALKSVKPKCARVLDFRLTDELEVPLLCASDSSGEGSVGIIASRLESSPPGGDHVEWGQGAYMLFNTPRDEHRFDFSHFISQGTGAAGASK